MRPNPTKLRKLAKTAVGNMTIVAVILALWPIGVILCALDALAWPFAMLHEALRDDAERNPE